MKRLIAVALLAAAVRADPDPATAQLPAAARIVFRLPSFDRLDRIANEVRPLLMFWAADPDGNDFRKTPPSALIRKTFGLTADITVDREKPTYVAMVAGEPVFLLPAGPRLAWEGERALLDGRVAAVKDGVIRIATPALLKGEPRGAPVALVAGDAVVHVFLDELIAEHRKEIDGAVGEALGDMKSELPEKLHGIVAWLGNAAKETLDGVVSLDYGLTLREGRLESDGLLRVKPRSKLQAYLAGMGPPRANDLITLLPDRYLVAADAATNPMFVYRDIMALADEQFGAGTAKSLAVVLGAVGLCGDALTGRGATAVNMIGLGGFNALAVYELSDPAAAKKALRSVDLAAVKKRIGELELPFAVQYEVAAAKHGETEMHRIRVRQTGEGAGLELLGGAAQSYLAVEGKYLLMATGATARRDLEAFIDRVRQNERTKHSHLAAMNRLGPKRNLGFTFNLGALKPFAMMVALGEPELRPVMNAIPDKMLLSTAVWLHADGLAWRGDWPLKEIAKISQAIYDYMKEKETERKLEEEFD